MIAPEDSTSGTLVDDYEGVSREFTQFETIATRGHNVLTRAQRHGRWHALKSLTPEAAEKEVYRQMQRKEMEILMELQHPGVEQVMGMEDVDGLGRCIVMEWVEGVTLDKWLAHQPSRSERLRVLRQLLDAVAYVHSQGIVHRDLKPSNIMVTTSGHNVKLIDFGLADTDSHAVLKQPAGTLSYMAPEQATTNRPDVRNDIYSLGMVMRTMNLGRRYRRVINRCLEPIDMRFESVEQMLEFLHRQDGLRRYMGWGGVAAVALGLIAVVVMQQAALQRMSARSDMMVDSMNRRLTQAARLAEQRIDSSAASTAINMGAMNDTLRLLREANALLERRDQERLARQRVVDEAIDKGVALVREANNATHISEHLDTVSRSDFMWLDTKDLIGVGRAKAHDYLHSIAGHFTTKEMGEIEYALDEYCDSYERRMNEKLYRVIYSRAITRE